jgi:3-hydroxyacyl-CoA dehydrogenase/enoyl-CoA hydratase/3-hydroxybutyryl-CoA epimerase
MTMAVDQRDASGTAVFRSSNVRVTKRADGIALLGIDVADRNVNVLNREVLSDLDRALQTVQGDPQIRLLAIRSDKASGFIAGADLHEFASVKGPDEATEISRAGHRLFNKLAALPFPTIAMIHGPCLGGGLELALACDYRLVVDGPKTQLGFPEVELGLIPGWGGTQRLPRVVGLERALQVIVGRRRLKAQDARRWGLADALASTEQELADQLNTLIDRALVQGKRVRTGLPLASWRQRFLESNPVGRFFLFRGTDRLLRKRVPEDMPAPYEAAKLVHASATQDLETGLAQERDATTRLGSTPACRNLVTLFLRMEQARKLPQADATLARSIPIKRVALVGAGAMGAGIAQLARLNGYELVVQEIDQTALSAGRERITNLFQKAADKQLISRTEAIKALDGIRYTTTWEGFADADLIVEAIIEDVAAKEAVFREMENRTKSTALLATNTSSLLVSRLQEGRKHPQRVAGLHFFNPVHKMPLVEVVRAPGTSNQAVAALKQWTIGLGKTPVEVADGPGFVVNRILMPYTYEAMLLLAEGLPMASIDSTMRKFGMPMGPFEMVDQVGLDVASHITRSMRPVFDERAGAYPFQGVLSRSLEAMCRSGWIGQKAGAGFYRYEGRSKKPNRAVGELLESETRANSEPIVNGPEWDLREARDRMVLATVNEAAVCLGQGLAEDEATIDLAMVLGTGWAPHRGGPLCYARDRGVKEVVQKLSDLAERLGPRFGPSPAFAEWVQNEH